MTVRGEMSLLLSLTANPRQKLSTGQMVLFTAEIWEPTNIAGIPWDLVFLHVNKQEEGAGMCLWALSTFNISLFASKFECG